MPAAKLAHLYDDLSGKVADALPVIRKRARHLEETVREHPGKAVAAVGLAALLVTAAVMICGKRD